MVDTTQIDGIVIPKGARMGTLLSDIVNSDTAEEWTAWALRRGASYWPADFWAPLQWAAALLGVTLPEEPAPVWGSHEARFVDTLLQLRHQVPEEEFLAVARSQPLEQLVLRLLRIIELKEMPYAEYLRTDEWMELAARAKERFGGRCALDAKHEAADAHHRTYERRGRERDTDVIPLCRACHGKFHGR